MHVVHKVPAHRSCVPPLTALRSAAPLSRAFRAGEVAVEPGDDMLLKTNQDDYAHDILVALHQIQDTPALQAEAQTQPESMMDRLALSGIARHAVAFALTASVVTPVVLTQVVQPDG